MRKSEAGATEDEEEMSAKADSDDDDLLAQAVAAVEAQGGGKKKKLFSKKKVPSREPSDPQPAVSSLHNHRYPKLQNLLHCCQVPSPRDDTKKLGNHGLAQVW